MRHPRRKQVKTTIPKRLSFQFGFRSQNYRFDIHYILVLLGLLVLALLLSLSRWQYQRGVQKATLEAASQYHSATKAKAFKEFINLPMTERGYFQRLKLEGVFDNAKNFLLDNQTHQGRVGYHVITPFYDQAAEAWVLVNRGWLLGSPYRDQLPKVPDISQQHAFVGLYKPLERPFLLQETEWQNTPEWPLRVQAIEIEKLSSLLPYSPAPFLVLMQPNEVEYGFVRDWKPVNMTASKHYGYTLQWFLLAIAWSILMLAAHIRRVP